MAKRCLLLLYHLLFERKDQHAPGYILLSETNRVPSEPPSPQAKHPQIPQMLQTFTNISALLWTCSSTLISLFLQNKTSLQVFKNNKLFLRQY